MFHGTSWATKPCSTEEHRNFLFWWLESFIIEESSQAILTQQFLENKPTILLALLLGISEHLLWIYPKICSLEQKKHKWSASQSNSQDSQASWRDSYIANLPFSDSAGGPFSRASSACSQKPAVRFCSRGNQEHPLPTCCPAGWRQLTRADGSTAAKSL